MAEGESNPPKRAFKEITCPVPVGSDLAAPAYPNRPTLFDEVEWGPFPSDEDIKKAYRVWSLPNNTLTASHPSTNGPSGCLARKVYESILTSSQLPIHQNEFVRHSPRGNKNTSGWTYNEIFGTEAEEPQQSPDNDPPNVLVQGHNPLIDTKYWTKARLQPELRARGINANGLVADLRQRLYDDELQKLQTSVPDEGEDKGSILPVQSLPEWGIERAANDYLVKITSRGRLSALDMYTWAISLSPYNPAYWTSRAYLHYQMGHFDLAIGDAYRAQLLCEKLVNPLNRHVQPGIYIHIWDAIERHILQTTSGQPDLSKEVELLRKGNGINSFIPIVRKAVHHIIVLSLLAMQCWEDYSATEPYLRTRLIMADRDKIAMQQRQANLVEFIYDAGKEKRHNYLEYLFERHYGFIACRQYPYDSWDNAPAIDKIAERMNKDMISKSQALAYRPRKIQVEVDDHRLAVYADEDIPKGAVIYVDEPSIRGHLQQLSRATAPRCENCRRPVTATAPVLWFEKGKENTESTSAENASCECANCYRTPMYWCTASDKSSSRDPSPDPEEFARVSRALETHRGKDYRDPSVDTDDEQAIVRGNPSKKQKISGAVGKEKLSCLHIARSLYHNRVCGKSWNWLHDAMRPNRWPLGSVPHELGSLSHTNEKHGTLLSLLLREVFDITLLRRETDNKPNLLAYEIDELMPVMQWSAIGKDLPFSFAANIQVPFDILSCLGVNIFRDLTFDTWVIQLALRKLLMSAIPWHLEGEERDKDVPESQNEKLKRTRDICQIPATDVDEVTPTFPNLYVFPVVSVFKHACPPHHNVDWHWDTEIPNRLILHANRAIRGGEELFLRYSKVSLPKNTAVRLFGRGCDCPGCGRDYSPEIPMVDYYGFMTSDEEPEIPSSPSEPQLPPQGHNLVRQMSPEPSMEGTSGENDGTEGLEEQKSNDSNQTEEQEEQEDYRSSPQEELAPNLYIQSYQGNTGYEQYQAHAEQPSHQLPGDTYLSAAQQALDLMPSYNPAEISPRHQGQENQQQEQSQEQTGASMMPRPAQNLGSSPDYSNVRSLHVPPPPLRRGGARVRHNGVMMTSQEYNLIRMREALEVQAQEQGEQEEEDQQGNTGHQDSN
ncbi:hypothetical protein MaudCBS49596_003959 [Microsporum audouinii]